MKSIVLIAIFSIGLFEVVKAQNTVPNGTNPQTQPNNNLQNPNPQTTIPQNPNGQYTHPYPNSNTNSNMNLNNSINQATQPGNNGMYNQNKVNNNYNNTRLRTDTAKKYK